MRPFKNAGAGEVAGAPGHQGMLALKEHTAGLKGRDLIVDIQEAMNYFQPHGSHMYI